MPNVSPSTGVLQKAECSGLYLDPDTSETTERVWSLPSRHFDTIFEGMLTVVQLSTLEGWLRVFFAGVDSVQVFSFGCSLPSPTPPLPLFQ